MNDYSQNGEGKRIAGYFGDRLGRVLSIGENDGITLSNVRGLIEAGWAAVLVEPSPEAFSKLSDLYEGSDDVLLVCVAIADRCGKLKFHDSGGHLGAGDTGLLSTLSEKDYKKWAPTTEFNDIEVAAIDINTFLDGLDSVGFDLISIDAEGMDLVILRGLAPRLGEIGASCICIEWNAHLPTFEEVYKLLNPLGYRLLHKNAENLIWVK